MKNITAIIIKIITFPITAVKWIFYGTLTYIFLFSIGFIIDRYVGWPPVIKPIRDSALTITIGIVKKITPPLQKLAKKFEAKEQDNGDATTIDKVDETDSPSANTVDEKGVMKKSEERQEAKIQTAERGYTLENIRIIEQFRESMTAMKKSIEAMSIKANTRQKINRSPKIFYGFFTLSILFLVINSYLLYQIMQK